MIDFLVNESNPLDNALEKLRKESPIILYGAGTYGKYVCSLLEERGVGIRCFCDDDYKKQKTGFLGYKVISSESLLAYDDKVLLSSFVPEKMIKRLKMVDESLLQRVYSYDFYLYENGLDYYEYFTQHDDELDEVYGLLADEKSKRVFINLLQYKISRNKALIQEIRDPLVLQYFDPTVMRLGQVERFLDLGAYTGDTISDFITVVNGKYRKIIGVEPDGANYCSLVKNTEKYNDVTVYQVGVSDSDGVVRFREDEVMTSAVDENGDTLIKVKSVDSLLNDEEITLLKSDIEGLEKNMLIGAEYTIRKYHPKIAIAVYHCKEDIFEIPAILKKFYSKYKFYLRHYTGVAVDSVLYAIS